MYYTDQLIVDFTVMLVVSSKISSQADKVPAHSEESVEALVGLMIGFTWAII